MSKLTPLPRREVPIQSKLQGGASVQRSQRYELIVGCGVGGIKAARLATGLETGTGEPESKVKFFIKTLKYGTDERTVESL